jgi:crotonobetainyl-CoA:carnitine CoA-transferase CaiB-like acyl-CoA transferase
LLLLYLNTAKRSISVNLESRVALRLLAALAQQTDVLITDLSLGAMEALPRGRRLVYTSIRPFGLDGPHAEWVWTEITVEALAGVMAVVGDPDRPPLKVGGAQAQYLGGLNAAVGTLLALEDRDRTGLGQVVDISMQESVLTILGNIPLLYSHLASWPGAAERRGDRELQRAGDTQLPSGLCQAARAESAADHGIDAQPRHGRTLQRLRGLR